ncbi:hypothetical protein V2J09_015730 [Rumex salicifolius]
MAGKHLSSFSSFARERPLYTSRLFLLALSLLSLLLLIFFVSSFSSTSPSLVARSTLPNSNPNPNLEYSFVVSLEQFLTNKLPWLRKMAAKDDTVSAAGDESVARLDDLIWRTEIDRLYQDSFYPASDLPLRVYVYEMPDKFTYDLLWLFRNSYKETDNLTSNGSPVHRLIEQHSIDYWLWADLIAPTSERLLKDVIRVHRLEEADLFYVPFFTTISFFLMEKQQCKSLYRGGKIRSKLVSELADAEGVVIAEGTAGMAGKAAAQQGMRKSTFCLSPAGDTPSSARLFDAIVSGCIPVIVSDELELPFEGIIDYRKMALFISSSDALQPGWLLSYLRSISPSKINEMQKHLAKYSRHFLYSSPAQPLGPEDLAWRMIAGKLVNIKLHIRRSQRVVKESRSLCTCDCRRANLTTAQLLS